MKIKIQMKQRTLIAKLIGELDHHSSTSAKELIEKEIINRAAKNLIFDLSELTFMDSSGIGMIIGRYKQIKAFGGWVNIVYSDKNLEKLINMSGLKKIIPVYTDINKSIENA